MKTPKLEREKIIDNIIQNQEIENGYIFVTEERNARRIIDYLTYAEGIQQEIKYSKAMPDAEIGSSYLTFRRNRKGKGIHQN